ncbi:hypothetical protein DENSPDRAFT_835480 [Dentipellis sp. KUC8613]|nr:hypothetical protein DENSPDRAFT_835480 [Dentipellis sp. KUC8613]
MSSPLSPQLRPLHDPDSPRLAPMDRLPVELLIEIFTYCAHAAAKNPLTLGMVCRRWKTIVESSPHMFQLVVLDESDRLYTLNHVAQACLERSKKLEIDVDLHIQSRDHLLPLLSPFLSSLHRWRSFRLSGFRYEYVDFEHLWHEPNGDPKLEQLDINVVDPDEIDSIADQIQQYSNGVTQGGTFRPYTTSLSSNLLSMDVIMSKLPAPRFLAPLRFVSLFICEGSLTLNIHPADLLHFLTACPELEYFSFNGLMAEVKFSPDDLQHPPPLVRLLHLRSLVLHSTLSARIILSHLYTPELRELYLEHLNVDFKFPVHNPYLSHRPRSAPQPQTSSDTRQPDIVTHPSFLASPFNYNLPSMLFCDTYYNETPYEMEDGDSDDECLDYSQSPYSDHATGMGIRSLISRSNPPLRVLEMDYADMRTKDFRWLFANVRGLEDFRIVASDMADRVISLLAPQFVPRRSDHPKDLPTVNCIDGRRYVEELVLPHLKSLELFNCQRLSGAAIVDAISRRAAMSDGLAQSGIDVYSPLEDIAVVQCSQFDAYHAAELAGALGERLRLQ